MKVRSRVWPLNAAIIAGFLFGCDKNPDVEQPQRSPVQREAESSVKSPTQISFNDRTDNTGVDFCYESGGHSKHYSILESLGGGVASVDIDSDGQTDLCFAGGGLFTASPKVIGVPIQLNRQIGPWKWEDVTESAKLNTPGFYSHGVAAADFDNDGWPDLLITGYGGLQLFRNNGDGTFGEVAQEWGLTDTLWSSGAAWGDFDGNGALDVYITHYVDWSFENNPRCPGPKPGQREICPPRAFVPQADMIYFSNTDGTFRDGSADAGLRSDGKGLGILSADVDLDGDCDVYVGNDTDANFLYLNDGAGRFTDSGMESGVALNAQGTPDGSMGVDVGDFDLDGRPDLWVANYEHETFALYHNDGNGLFRHASQSAGISAVEQVFVGWGTVFVDADNDRDEDLFVSNGHVSRYPVNSTFKQSPLFLENIQGRQLKNVTSQAGSYFNAEHSGRGVSATDLDNDGDCDLVISHLDHPATLLENVTKSHNHWLGLRLIGIESSRTPIGGHVRIRTQDGTQIRLLKGGSSYASTNDSRVFFGLGDSVEIKELFIYWPGGKSQTIREIAPDRFHTIHEQSAPDAE